MPECSFVISKTDTLFSLLEDCLLKLQLGARLDRKLDDASLKRAERSRIVEVLADIEEMEKAA